MRVNDVVVFDDTTDDGEADKETDEEADEEASDAAAAGDAILPPPPERTHRPMALSHSCYGNFP